MKNTVACFEFKIEKHAYKGEMQALTHFWITKTKTLNLHRRPELFVSTITELQLMRILVDQRTKVSIHL